MADISMCFNEDCVLKEHCVRYLATPEPFQSYIEVEGDGTDCDFYWEVRDEQE